LLPNSAEDSFTPKYWNFTRPVEVGEAEEEVEVVVLVLVVDVVGLVLVVDVVILVVDVNDVVLLVVVVEPVDFKHLGAARKPEVS